MESRIPILVISSPRPRNATVMLSRDNTPSSNQTVPCALLTTPLMTTMDSTPLSTSPVSDYRSGPPKGPVNTSYMLFRYSSSCPQSCCPSCPLRSSSSPQPLRSLSTLHSGGWAECGSIIIRTQKPFPIKSLSHKTVSAKKLQIFELLPAENKTTHSYKSLSYQQIIGKPYNKHTQARSIIEM